MAGMRISELDFLRLLPVFMRDDEAVAALSDAMNSLLGTPSERIPVLRTWDQIDELTSEECDELAWEMDIDWYDAVGMSLEEKRETIKCALQVKRKRGTKKAVEQMLEAYTGESCSVEEWYEYGDSEYYFKVSLDALLTEENLTALITAIGRVKNTRSHLRRVEVQRTASAVIYAGCGQYQSYRPAAIMDGYSAQYETVQTVYTGIGARASYNLPAVRDGYSVKEKTNQAIYTGTTVNAVYSNPPVM